MQQRHSASYGDSPANSRIEVTSTTKFRELIILLILINVEGTDLTWPSEVTNTNIVRP
jgi:hypothetical protein